ncbi:3-hydroxyacyl-ACP dehydratase FabZ [bacterium]|nr:3-hydroxyacyl-ACP dehydratase FabZ [bacterium]
MIKIKDILKILPHRYPFLLVDKVIEIEPGKKAVGLKNVTINEPFFQGHFPGEPIMPGVLILEAMAQVGGVLLLSMTGNEGKLAYFGGMDNVRFRKPVHPGDTLIMEVEIIKTKGNAGKVKATAKVEGKLVAEGEFIFMLVERAEPYEEVEKVTSKER